LNLSLVVSIEVRKTLVASKFAPQCAKFNFERSERSSDVRQTQI
jgi:hypothetical protein